MARPKQDTSLPPEAESPTREDNFFSLSMPSQNKPQQPTHVELSQKAKRREELDSQVLQMQIEQDKMKKELEKIGEHPKTVQ